MTIVVDTRQYSKHGRISNLISGKVSRIVIAQVAYIVIVIGTIAPDFKRCAEIVEFD